MIKVKRVHIEYKSNTANSKKVLKKVSFHEFPSIEALHQTVREIARNSPLHTTVGTRGSTIAFASTTVKQQWLDKFIPLS